MVIHRNKSHRIWVSTAILATLFQLCFSEENSSITAAVVSKASTSEFLRPKRQGYYGAGSGTGLGGLSTSPSNAYLPSKDVGGASGIQRPSGAFGSQGASGGGEVERSSLDTTSSFGSPAGGFDGSHNGPSNTYLPPGGGSTSVERHQAEFGNKGPSGSSNTYSAPGYNGPSAGLGSFSVFPSGSGSQRPSSGFGGQRSSENNISGRPSGSYDITSATSRFGGQDSTGGSASGGQIADTYGAPVSGVGRFVGQQPAGLRLSDTNDSPASQLNGFLQRPPGGRPMGTYSVASSSDNRFGDQGHSGGRSLETNGVPSSGDNGFGGQGPSGGSGFGSPSGKYDAQTASGNGFGRQGLSGESAFVMSSGTYDAQAASGSGFGRLGPSVGNGFGRPSGTYDAPTSSGRVFSTQRTFVGHEFGGQPSGATASRNSRFGDQTHSGGHPLGGYGATSGGISHPSNVHISSVSGIGRHSQESTGRIGSQNTGSPSSFHNAPGPNGGYNGSPNGASNTYLPPASGGSFGSQGPPRNSGLGGQHGFGPGSSNSDGSNNGLIASSGNRNGDFGGQKSSESYNVPAGGGPSGGSGTYRAGSFAGPSNAYLPPGSSFNDQQFSGSFSLGDPRPGGNGFSSSRDGTSNSYDNQSNDATGFGRLSPGSPSSYSSSGSLLSQQEVPQPGGFSLRPQTANSGDGGPERNGFQRLPTSYTASNNEVGSGQPPRTSGFPSQRQLDSSAFEGYKY